MTESGTAIEVAFTGLGYIGLPTAACLATGRLEVNGVDLSEQIVDQAGCGETPFA